MCVSIVRATRIQFITFKMHAVHFSLCQLIVFCFMLFSQSLFLQQSLVFGWFSDFVVSAELWKKKFSNNKTNLYASENCIRINEHRQCTLYTVHHRYEHFTHEEYILHSVDLIELMRLMCVCAYTLYCRWWWVLRPIERLHTATLHRSATKWCKHKNDEINVLHS